jgi:DNA-binding MarR family transcriptional regulator
MLQMQQVSKAAEKAWVAILRSGALIDRVESALKAAGHPPLAWYDVLWELERAGGPIRQRDLGQRLLVARYNLSRLLDRLAAEGLIAAEPCHDDARGQMWRLTRTGKALRVRIWPAYAAAIRRAVEERLSAAEAETLAKLLEKLR